MVKGGKIVMTRGRGLEKERRNSPGVSSKQTRHTRGTRVTPPRQREREREREADNKISLPFARNVDRWRRVEAPLRDFRCVTQSEIPADSQAARLKNRVRGSASSRVSEPKKNRERERET